jgi:hypothetical protein
VQPLVLQYGRWDAAARRRSRRIELDRPATAVVMVLLVIVAVLSCRARREDVPGRGRLTLDTPKRGAERLINARAAREGAG